MLWHRSIGFFALLALVTVTALSIAMPMETSAGDRANLGNSPVAKMCQKDGWTNLARAESPTIAFANEEECVSFGAQGGTIVALQQAPVGKIWIEFPAAGDVNFYGSGLMPGSTLTIHLERIDSPYTSTAPGVVDANGSYQWISHYGCGYVLSFTLTGTGADGSQVSAYAPAACS